VTRSSSMRERLLHQRWSLGTLAVAAVIVILFVSLVEFSLGTFGIVVLAVIVLGLGITFTRSRGPSRG
jgi:hypothetical protein